LSQTIIFQSYKTFFLVTNAISKKLERLSLASLLI
jgi:hypothetical protein